MLITNATLITWEPASNRILDDHALLIENDRIKEIGTTSELRSRYSQIETFDARGQYVMPGNICAHTHFYGAYARGMAIPGAAPKDFLRSYKSCGGRWIGRWTRKASGILLSPAS